MKKDLFSLALSFGGSGKIEERSFTVPLVPPEAMQVVTWFSARLPEAQLTWEIFKTEG